MTRFNRRRGGGFKGRNSDFRRNRSRNQGPFRRRRRRGAGINKLRRGRNPKRFEKFSGNEQDLDAELANYWGKCENEEISKISSQKVIFEENKKLESLKADQQNGLDNEMEEYFKNKPVEGKKEEEEEEKKEE